MSQISIGLPELDVSSADTRMRDAVSLFSATERGSQVQCRAYDASSPLDGYAQALKDLQSGTVDCVLAGSILSSRDVIRGAIKSVGLAEGSSTVSSSMVMRSDDTQCADVYFADPAVNPSPTPGQLVDIAFATVETMRALNPGVEPRVAFLSFSTYGSASHALVDHVREAIGLTLERSPTFFVADQEVQFDAALNPAIAATKITDSSPGSLAESPANILIFPDLNAGNIAYKAFAGPHSSYRAVGPVLQGLARPVNDLSRGSTPQEIAQMIDVTVQLAAMNNQSTAGR